MITIPKAGPLAAVHLDKKVNSLPQAESLAHEEAARMDTGFRLSRDEASALAHVCAANFVFRRPAQHHRFVNVFITDAVERSLGRLAGHHDYDVRTEGGLLAVSRKDAAEAFAGLDAAWYLSKHDPLTWEEAVAIGDVFAHAYSYTDRSLVGVYVQTFARCVRAK